MHSPQSRHPFVSPFAVEFFAFSIDMPGISTKRRPHTTARTSEGLVVGSALDTVSTSTALAHYDIQDKPTDSHNPIPRSRLWAFSMGAYSLSRRSQCTSARVHYFVHTGGETPHNSL